MEQVDLIAGCDSAEDLGAFAAAFFDALDVEIHEERESENYTGGSYFVGKREGLEFNIAISDDLRHGDMPYWIEVSAASVSVIDAQVRERLLPRGFRVARVFNFGEAAENRVVY